MQLYFMFFRSLLLTAPISEALHVGTTSQGNGATREVQPLSSSDKEAVGAALTDALKAMQGHGSGSKFESCSQLFPDGKPPADPKNPTWLSCKSLVGIGADVISLGTKRKSLAVREVRPLSSSDKEAVGAALTDALNAMQGDGSGSKFESCSHLFPDGKPPADPKNPTWLSCKSIVGIGEDRASFGTKRAALAVRELRPLSSSDGQTAGPALTDTKGFVDPDTGYAEDWQTEHRSEPYPPESKGKWHHPDYGNSEIADQVERSFAQSCGLMSLHTLLFVFLLSYN